jgi:hypothetical protein
MYSVIDFYFWNNCASPDVTSDCEGGGIYESIKNSVTPIRNQTFLHISILCFLYLLLFIFSFLFLFIFPFLSFHFISI